MAEELNCEVTIKNTKAQIISAIEKQSASWSEDYLLETGGFVNVITNFNTNINNIGNRFAKDSIL